MKKFEYTIVRGSGTDTFNSGELDIDSFNSLGQLGWELVAITHDPYHKKMLVYHFRREVEE